MLLPSIEEVVSAWQIPLSVSALVGVGSFSHSCGGHHYAAWGMINFRYNGYITKDRGVF